MLGYVGYGTLLVALLQVAMQATAQTSRFQWGFGSQVTQTSFQECEQVSLAISSNGSFLGVPPYFLVAFELGGIPTQANIGSDYGNLSWKADHKRGTNLMFTIVDSQGNVGDLAPSLYTMTEGSDTSCIASPPQNLPVITSNVTDDLGTCDPWGLLIAGGTKPYSLYLTALTASVITIVEMGANDNLYTYINRAAPGTLLSVSVLDGNDQWGVSPQPIRTSGSTDVECGGFLSSSGTSPVSPSSVSSTSVSSSLSPSGTSAAGTVTSSDSAQQSGSTSQKTANVPIIAGLSVGLGVPLVLALAALIWWRHRRAQTTEKKGDQSAHPNTRAARAPALPVTPFPPDLRSLDTDSRVEKSSEGGRRNPTDAPPSSTAPIPSVQSSREEPPAMVAVASELFIPEMRSRPGEQGAVVQHRDEHGIIFQHRDAGLVRELPPPYAESRQRSLPRMKSSTPGSSSSGSRQF